MEWIGQKVTKCQSSKLKKKILNLFQIIRNQAIYLLILNSDLVLQIQLIPS